VSITEFSVVVAADSFCVAPFPPPRIRIRGGGGASMVAGKLVAGPDGARGRSRMDARGSTDSSGIIEPCCLKVNSVKTVKHGNLTFFLQFL
jgi:hypothetical protein